MKAITAPAYLAFEPTTRAATALASDFVQKMESWRHSKSQAEQQLKATCREHSNGAKPIGFLSKDPLNMSVFGVMFDKTPGKGFIPAPTSVSVSVKDSCSSGLAYIPDVKTPAGQKIFKAMTALSTVCEKRPLLTIDGIQGVALTGKGLQMASAVMNGDSVQILAPEFMVKANAPVVKAKPKVNLNAPKASIASTTRRRPSPFDDLN